MKAVAGFVANLAGWLSKRLGRGGGTTLPGVVLLKLRPQALAEYASELRYGTVTVSATNGKTTTTRLVTAAAEQLGFGLVTNAEGSNLERGVAAALLKKPKHAELGIFEVDEAALPAVTTAAGPGVVVLMNLFRDQLDRYGELETLVDRWQTMIEAFPGAETPTLVLNADDPNIADLGRNHPDVVWFGISDARHGLSEREHAADATTCRRCGRPLEHSLVLLGHLGHWACPNGDSTRPPPSVHATAVELREDGQRVTISYPDPSTSELRQIDVESPLPGLHNAYNLVAAFATTIALAARADRMPQPETIAKALGDTKPAFGRGERVTIDDKTLTMLLAKNPTGVNQNVRTILDATGDLDVLVLLNDRTADGQDVSWIWDVDWERLKPRLNSLTLGGERAWDLALRFRYGGFDMDAVKVAPDVSEALDIALADAGPGQHIYALPTYTAMLDLRGVLTQRGHTTAYWEDEA